MLGLITLPSPAQLLTYDQVGEATTTQSNSMSDMSAAMFSELAPYALAFTGLILGALFVKFIVQGGFKASATKLIGRGSRRRGRRR